jgi:hypothetical protein
MHLFGMSQSITFLGKVETTPVNGALEGLQFGMSPHVVKECLPLNKGSTFTISVNALKKSILPVRQLVVERLYLILCGLWCSLVFFFSGDI